MRSSSSSRNVRRHSRHGPKPVAGCVTAAWPQIGSVPRSRTWRATSSGMPVTAIAVISPPGRLSYRPRNARRGENVRSESGTGHERLDQLLLEPRQVGVDGELGGAGVARVKVEAHLLGHVEPRAEDEAEVVQDGQPGLGFLGGEGVAPKRRLNRRDSPLAAAVELVPDEVAVGGFG